MPIETGRVSSSVGRANPSSRGPEPSLPSLARVGRGPPVSTAKTGRVRPSLDRQAPLSRGQKPSLSSLVSLSGDT